MGRVRTKNTFRKPNTKTNFMKSMRAFLYFFILSTFFMSCTSKKKVVEAPPPDLRPTWVKQRPVNSGYYIGVGIASKTSSPVDYAQIAKNNALNDLSSEISVSISNTSILYQVEHDSRFEEEYKSNTKTASKELLEGYEVVDIWETEKDYWVYYRLAKATHQQLKKERQDKAVAQSIDLLDKAKSFKEETRIRDAVIYTVKAIESIKNYLGEPLQIDYQGKTTFYGNELMSTLTDYVNNIRLIPASEELSVKKGQAMSDAQLSVTAFDEDYNPIPGLPIYFYYSERRIKSNEVNTNTEGQASYHIDKVTTANNTAFFQANVNLVNMTKEATEDPFIAKLIAKLSTPEARIRITIEKPLIYVESEEKNLDKDQEVSPLANAFRRKLSAGDFTITPYRKQADYVLSITANTSKGPDRGNFFTSFLDATFKVTDKQKETVYTHQIQSLKGVQLDHEKAGADAYKKATKRVEQKIFRDFKRKLFE